MQEGTRLLWLTNNRTNLSNGKVTQEKEKSLSTVLLDISSHPRNKTCYVPGSTLNPNDKISSLSRKMFALSRENDALKW